MKTNYRTIHNGHWEVLQYENTYKVVEGYWWWKKEVEKTEWFCVPRPYYDSNYGRSDPVGAQKYINSLNCNLDYFVKTYPDVDVYLKYYFEKQAELVTETKEAEERYHNNKDQVRYFQ
jgi:hypothetical protein